MNSGGSDVDAAFWLQRWQRNEIGFHQEAVNAHLVQHWPALGIAHGACVLVPLCGKSRDMVWLRDRGHPVIGVELSAQAVEAFYAEQGLQPHRMQAGAFERFDAGGITALCGDLFALNPATLGEVSGCPRTNTQHPSAVGDPSALPQAVFDRAALIALPPHLRRRYVEHITTLLPAGAETLLITFEYEQSQMNGPPFAVPEEEVRSLYRAHHAIRVIGAHDVLESEPRFRERGLRALHEKIYHLTRLSS